MIYKNNCGSTVVQFGIGDIEISSGRILTNDKKESYPCCCFTELKENHPIGSCTKPENNEPAKEKDDADLIFVFTDIRSFDVVIEGLQWAKKRFELNRNKILNPQEITDELA